MTEHEKLKPVQPFSQKIHEFIEWLGETHKIELCEHFDAGPGGDPQLFPVHKTTTQLVAEFFEIDLKKLEDEKQVMLEGLRNRNMGVHDAFKEKE